MKKTLLVMVAVLSAVACVTVTAMEATTPVRDHQFRIINLFRARLLNVMQTLDGGCGGGGCGGGGGGGGGGCNNSTFTNLTGVLAKQNMTFKIGTVRLNFGPYWYINATTASYDYDGDGSVETILAELNGLVGATVTLYGKFACQQTRFMVMKINGLPYRCLTIRS